MVISQSMYFPWVGLLEQIRLADVFVHYDDVQLTRGFYNRVQVKTTQGIRWLTVPLRDFHRGQRIDEAQIDDREDWRQKHRDILKQAYRKAEFCDEMLNLVDCVFSLPAHSLADVSRNSILAIAEYFNISNSCQFVESTSLQIEGRSSQRLLDIVQALAGNIYITGHGAKNYLDHELFEQAGVFIQYMKYRSTPYPQQHGDFTPYVTSLDLIANCGRMGASVIKSESIDWNEFVRNDHE